MHAVSRRNRNHRAILLLRARDRNDQTISFNRRGLWHVPADVGFMFYKISYYPVSSAALIVAYHASAVVRPRL
jgi:hypothetical protein